MQEIKGKKFKINRIVFYNNESKWGIIGTSPIDDLGDYKLSLMNEFSNVTLTGNFVGAYEGAEIVIDGDIIENPRYGKQVQIRNYKILKDTKTKEGVVNFLSKNEIRGISTQNAKKIYERFGQNSIDIVLNKPEELLKINGIGEKTVLKIKESAIKYKENEEFYKYVAELGINYTLAEKILEEFGKGALQKIQEDPFSLLEVSSNITFKQVDDIFIKQGGDPNNKRRLDLALLYLLRKLAMLEGSTGVASKYLRSKFYETLKISIESGIYENTIKRLERNNKIQLGEGSNSGKIYYKEYLDMEQDIAGSLISLEANGLNILEIDDSVVNEELHNFPFTLNQQQVKAVHDCLEHHVSVLTGAAGSGKSSITKALYRIYERSGFNVELLSPTAKACRRLEECTGGKAQTIHKFLRMTKDGKVPKGNPYSENTVLVVDEASMLDIILFTNLLAGISLTSRILLVGDNNQLPSVQAGNVLGDVIGSKKIHVSLLTDIMRQQEDSNIIKYCSMINEGKIMDPCDHVDFHYEEFGSAQDLKDVFFPKYLEEVKEFGLNEVQVIAPYKKGELGMDNLNLMLQNVYQQENKGTVYTEIYRRGDRVRHTVNNYNKDVFNGETGIVTGYIDEELLVDYGNKGISYDERGLEELTLSYASTVHSSQGSEYKVVFVILDDTSANSFLHIRRLLYTAVSRGKKRVYIYTKPYLVDKCIMNSSYRPRITKLKEFLVNRVEEEENNNE